MQDIHHSHQHQRVYMPTLNGIRGLACLVVMYAHLTIIDSSYLTGPKWGAVGVLVFFSLSGFLMGKLYLDKVFTVEKAVNYIISRASRITPAYYLAGTICWLIYLYSGTDSFYPMNIRPMDTIAYLRHLAFIGSVGVFWSIPPEVQFYSVFLIIWGVWYLKSQSHTLPLLTVVTIISIVSVFRSDLPGIFVFQRFIFLYLV